MTAALSQTPVSPVMGRELGCRQGRAVGLFWLPQTWTPRVLVPDVNTAEPISKTCVSGNCSHFCFSDSMLSNARLRHQERFCRVPALLKGIQGGSRRGRKWPKGAGSRFLPSPALLQADGGQPAKRLVMRERWTVMWNRGDNRGCGWQRTRAALVISPDHGKGGWSRLLGARRAEQLTGVSMRCQWLKVSLFWTWMGSLRCISSCFCDATGMKV